MHRIKINITLVTRYLDVVLWSFTAPGAVKEAGTISWPDDVNSYPNQALALLDLVLLVFVVFINCFLVFVLSNGCGCICFASTQPSDWSGRPVFFAPAKWSAGKMVSVMTYNVSSGITGMLYYTIFIAIPFVVVDIFI